ncbi:DEAD/DEAH box helicase domain-containing protein [Ditylenchus destructor]|uniref:RNA helicase n=1 Tax=Ditylenchus destructor TaxID=166010 RepID=A0AAD4MFT2_9BILA|nr:DEAD/DEAH box helicase domain-containing protein [Ditylenchus destructor]
MNAARRGRGFGTSKAAPSLPPAAAVSVEKKEHVEENKEPPAENNVDAGPQNGQAEAPTPAPAPVPAVRGVKVSRGRGGLGRGGSSNETSAATSVDAGPQNGQAEAPTPAPAPVPAVRGVKFSRGRGGLGRGGSSNETSAATSVDAGPQNGQAEAPAPAPVPAVRGVKFSRGRGGLGRGGSNNESSATNGVEASNQNDQTDAAPPSGRGPNYIRGTNTGRGSSFGRGAARGGGQTGIGREKPEDQDFAVNKNDAGENRRENNGADVNSRPPKEEKEEKDPRILELFKHAKCNHTSGFGHMPVIRSIEDLIKEDEEQSQQYSIVADEDEDVAIMGEGVQHISKLDTWEDAHFEDVLLNNIVGAAKCIRPRKIQSMTIPLVLEGFDVKSHAETGSGKTAAFMLPIINDLMKMDKDRSPLQKPAPYAIIIEPTRELCLQVYEQGRKFANNTGILLGKAYGQYDKRQNRRELQGNGCDILCVTPGRFKDIVYDNWINLQKIKYLVFDEADCLMEHDFLETIRCVILLPDFPSKEKRQTLMYSATFPKEIQQLAADIMKENNVVVSKKKPLAPNSRVKQEFIQVGSKDKRNILYDLLKQDVDVATEKNPEKPDIPRTLVFVKTKQLADQLAIYLSLKNIKAITINGDRNQCQREFALRGFSDKDIVVLVSTDVCARGIDIKNLDHVINFDLPTFKGKNPADPEDEAYDERPITYVQRIGRTGRLRTGKATSFFDEDTNNDCELAKYLVEFVRDGGQEPPDFLVRAANNAASLYSGRIIEDPWAEDETESSQQQTSGTRTPAVTATVRDIWDEDD